MGDVFVSGTLTVIDEGINLGLCTTLSFMCTKCGKKSSSKTSKLIDERGKSFDINRRVAYAMAEQGKGRQALADFCSIMGMPPPPSDSSWALHNNTIHAASMDVMRKECVQAGKRLREHLKEDDASVTDSSLIDVTVSFDGTWHHRGFKSSHGVGIAMSVDTGEILDAVVLSKLCVVCDKKAKLLNKDEFQAWLSEHKASGSCQQNFEGPSTSMETKAAKILWVRSIQVHKMRYVRVLSDGDNKTLSALNELKIYDVAIEKLDCINHVHKRLGTGLRNLLKVSAVIKGGKGGLTKGMIEKLTNYYRNSIMANTTKSKDATEIDECVDKMQKAIMASSYHSVYNSGVF